MTHDVLACIERSGGPKDRAVRTDGYVTVVHLSCHCGKQVTHVSGETWEPRKIATGVPICPGCDKPVMKNLGYEIEGKLAHGLCAKRPGQSWADERKEEFVKDYNSRVPLQTLFVRYGLNNGTIWKLTKQLREEGFELGFRKSLHNQGNRTRRKATATMRERHQTALAGIAG